MSNNDGADVVAGLTEAFNDYFNISPAHRNWCRRYCARITGEDFDESTLEPEIEEEVLDARVRNWQNGGEVEEVYPDYVEDEPYVPPEPIYTEFENGMMLVRGTLCMRDQFGRLVKVTSDEFDEPVLTPEKAEMTMTLDDGRIVPLYSRGED